MTTTQLDDVSEVRPGDGSAAGMIAWLGWAIEKNELPEATASALRTGCQKVLEVEADLAHLHVPSLDVDDVLRRFQNRHRGTQMKDSTMTAYGKRFRQTVEMYKKWIDNDDSWRPSTRNRSSASTSAKKADSKVQEAAKETDTPNGDAGPNLINYPFPIRPGLQGIVSLPEDLTTKEAKRISNFVASLAFEDEPTPHVPLAITNGQDASA